MRGKLLAILLMTASTAFAQSRKTLGVESFDFTVVMASVQAIFGNQQNIGAGIGALAAERVRRDGCFAVLDRKAKGSAQLALIGDVLVFGRDDRWNSTPTTAPEGDKAVVVLAYRIIDNETSQAIARGEVRGESKRVTGSFGSALSDGLGTGNGGVDMTGSAFAATLIGEATLDAVDLLAKRLRAACVAVSATDRTAGVDARAADVEGLAAAISAGTEAAEEVALGFVPGERGGKRRSEQDRGPFTLTPEYEFCLGKYRSQGS